jgi:hypothetical protein
MNRLAIAAAGLALAAAWVAVCARRLPPADNYWQGFADGELHAQLEERTPSLN